MCKECDKLRSEITVLNMQIYGLQLDKEVFYALASTIDQKGDVNVY